MTIEKLPTENKHSFVINHNGNKYNATIWLDSDSYKFIDWMITDIKTGETADQEIEDEIIQYIDENWDKL